MHMLQTFKPPIMCEVHITRVVIFGYATFIGGGNCIEGAGLHRGVDNWPVHDKGLSINKKVSTVCVPANDD